MTDRIVTGANGRKYINNEPRLHSPQRKPLTEEDIERLYITAKTPMAFARAIERWHRITS